MCVVASINIKDKNLKLVQVIFYLLKQLLLNSSIEMFIADDVQTEIDVLF